MTPDRETLSRREMLAVVTGAVLSALVRIEPAAATPTSMKAAIRNVVGEAPVKQGKVKLEVPPLVENGNTVALAIEVDSPMTQANHVKAIHVFNELNPQPNVISVKIGPRAGRARISTRFRLADTQTVVAIAEMSDGTFWEAKADVVVTLQACLETL
jgi:sulfur-oxidizing protein SoxY